MSEINIHEAKTQLSKLLRRVSAGEEIIIARSGKPVAKLVPVDQMPKRVFGLDRGLYEVPNDFDDPLSNDQIDEFEA